MSDLIKNLNSNVNTMSAEQAQELLNKGELSADDISLIANSDLSKLSSKTLQALRTAAMTVQANTSVGNGNSPSGVGPALATPTGELNFASISDLSNILGLLDSKTQALNNKVSLDLIKSNSAVRKEELNKTMAKLDEQIKKAKEEEKMGFWQKVLGAISKAFGFLAAAVTIAVGAVTGNPLLIIGGCALLFTQIDSLVAEHNDGVGISGLMLKGVGNLLSSMGIMKEGFSDETLKNFNMYFDMALGLVAGVACAFACPGALVGHAKALVTAIQSSISIGTSVTGIANGGVGIARGDVQADIVRLQADMKKHQAKKVWLDMFQQALVDALKANIENIQKMIEKVKQIAEGERQTTEEIAKSAPTSA